jgi:hypothetical protein
MHLRISSFLLDLFSLVLQIFVKFMITIFENALVIPVFRGKFLNIL